MTRFFIGDTHIGSRSILRCQHLHRPFSSIEEHDEVLVDRWNSVVGNRDEVWHLGDVLSGRESFKHLDRLNGIKMLVLGNHDKYPVQEYAKYFQSIHGGKKIRSSVLTHVPVHPNQFGRYEYNIHGHLHDQMVTRVIQTEEGYEEVPDYRYVNVSAEQINLTPISFEEIMEKR